MNDALSHMSRKADLAIIIFKMLIAIACLSLLFLSLEAMGMEFLVSGDDLLLVAFDALIVVAYLVTGVFFMIWFYAAYKRSYLESPQSLRYPPVWTVLGFSLPVANWFMPYVLAVNLWRRLAEKRTADINHAPCRAPHYFKVWWLSHLAVFFGMPVVYFAALANMEHSELLPVLFIMSALACLLICTSARFAIRLVTEITFLQRCFLD